MHISLSPPLKEWVEQQIAHHGFSTVSEYIRQLLREEQTRQARISVEGKLAEAIESGNAVPVAAQTWKDTESRVQKRLKGTGNKRKDHGTNR